MASLKQRIRSGESLYWTNITSQNTELPELIKRADFDFVVIDGLNGHLSSAETAAETIRICKSIGLHCIYRSDSDTELIRALDQGADGVACMNIANREDMLQFRNRIYFHPKGQRRPNPFTPQGHYGIGNFSEIKKRANDDTVLWVFIEERVKTIEGIREILSTEDIDLAYLGHYVNSENSESMLLANAFQSACRENGVAIAGFHYDIGRAAYDRADALKFSIQSPSVVGISTDMNLFYKGLQQGLENLKKFHNKIHC